jgi:hypothetical protein
MPEDVKYCPSVDEMCYIPLVSSIGAHGVGSKWMALAVAEDVNGWVATAEEYVEFREKRGQILKASEDPEGDIAV